ncbi:MAG: translation initiation factor IF-2 N-terminal domain-containing protein, partial [Acidimicrobiales bacterium]
MARKIRVYELARELGLTNKEALDLSLSLGIGVKSHSSSIEDAQADRVRRKAEREGLIREAQPAPEPVAEPAPKPVKSAPVARRAPVVEPAPEPVPEPAPTPVAEIHRVVRSRPASELGEAPPVPAARPTTPNRPAV